MQFNVKSVFNCLAKSGKVFTVRSYWLKNANVFVDGVGLCRRIRGHEIKDKSELYHYVGLSGFKNIDDWWEKIVKFTPGKKKKYIYLVKKLND